MTEGKKNLRDLEQTKKTPNQNKTKRKEKEDKQRTYDKRGKGVLHYSHYILSEKMLNTFVRYVQQKNLKACPVRQL